MSDRFPPDWFVRQNPWVSWMPDAAPNPAPTSPAAAPTSSMLPASTSDHDGSLSFHHGGFNWMETPNGGLLAVHPNGEGVDWVETPDGGLLAYPKRQVQSILDASGIPEHLDSARSEARRPVSMHACRATAALSHNAASASSGPSTGTRRALAQCSVPEAAAPGSSGASACRRPTRAASPPDEFPMVKGVHAPPGPAIPGGERPPLCQTARSHALRRIELQTGLIDACSIASIISTAAGCCIRRHRPHASTHLDATSLDDPRTNMARPVAQRLSASDRRSHAPHRCANSAARMNSARRRSASWAALPTPESLIGIGAKGASLLWRLAKAGLRRARPTSRSSRSCKA